MKGNHVYNFPGTLDDAPIVKRKIFLLSQSVIANRHNSNSR